MKRKRIVLTAVLVLLQLCCSRLWAWPATAYQAEKVVAGWLKADAQPLGTTLGQEVTKVDTYTDDYGEPIYYIVYLQPSGFVIVPADDLVEPIIGFVEKGTYDPSPENPLGALVSRDLKSRIAAVRDIQRLQATAAMETAFECQDKWSRLEGLLSDPPTGLEDINDVRVPPLVQSKWGQTTCCTSPPLACYNYYTPPSDPCDPCDFAIISSPNSPFPYGNPNNYPCGCVATAMAQLMRFHQHPTEEIGKKSFAISVNAVPQLAWTRGGDGLGGPYNWDLMTLVPDCNTPEPNRQAIGALCYDAGISVSANYTFGLTSADSNDVNEAMVDTFLYSNAILGREASWKIEESSLNRMINPNLDYNHPVILRLLADIPHVVLVDGYGYNLSTLYHHFNMGWGGQFDAWYYFHQGYQGLPPGFWGMNICVYNIFVSGEGEIISGRVIDAYGNPVPDVNITAQGPGGPYNAVTNTNGIYALAHVNSNSTYNISPAKTGYDFTDRTETTGISGAGSPPNTPGNLWGIDFEPFEGAIFVYAGATGLDDGSNWTNAYIYLQDALAAASSNDVILVAQGTYKPDQGGGNTPGNRNATFQLKNGVTIYGSFPAGGCNSLDDRDPNTCETILSGDIGTVDNKADNSYHVVTGDGTDSTAILDGFTITAGNADGPATDSIGGGIFCWSSGSPTITHCNITGNFALLGGGICCNSSSNASISYCTISGNTGAAWGGGIVFANGTPNISHSTITGNWANRGGGIYCIDDGPQITHCTITYCTISGNRAVVVSDIGGGIGGGISCDGWSDTTISNCIFWDNSAPTGPEIALEFDCDLTVSYTKVQGGQATAYVEGDCTLNWGLGNTNADPCFADSGYWDPNDTPADANDDFWVDGDYHLKSQAGRWDPNSKSWVNDAVTSPCIDLGNPGCPLGDEPNDANNVRINMGAYGGTTEASKTPAGWGLLADLTNDGTVDFKDFAWQAKDWQDSESEQPGDLNRSSTVDIGDVALFVVDWLEQTIWYEP